MSNGKSHVHSIFTGDKELDQILRSVDHIPSTNAKPVPEVNMRISMNFIGYGKRRNRK